MKSQDWALAALCFLTFVLLVVSYSITWAKGAIGGPNIDVGTIHKIGALNNASPRIGNGGGGGPGLQPPAMNMAPMAPAMPSAPSVNPGARDFSARGKSTKQVDKDTEVTGSLSSSARKRVPNTNDLEAAAQAESRLREAPAEPANASTNNSAIIPSCN